MDHTEAQLEDAAGGICYRARQLVDCADELLAEIVRVADGGEPLDTHVHNAYMESALVNSRVLAQFLCHAHGGKYDYVVAPHYDETWEPLTELGAYFEKISQTLVHAMYVGKPGWPIGRDTARIIDGLVAFVTQLERTQPTRAGWFSDPIHQTAALMRAVNTP